MPPAFRRLLVGYAVFGAVLWTTPLLSILHVETSAVVATASFFGVGLTMPSLLRGGHDLRRIILLQEAALLVPWLFLTVSLLWQPNCGYVQGLLFYLIFPGITVLFAASLFSLTMTLHVRRPGLMHAAIGVAILIIGPLYDIGFHPQFYTYNHVFGGFLGPIYDEQLSIRPGLFAFRTLTILWAFFFLLVASNIRREKSRIPTAATALGIGAFYVWAPQLGIVTTHEIIQQELGSVRYTEHFAIYYDSDVVAPRDIGFIAEDHEFRYSQLVEELHATVNGRIRSYIYPDAATKGQLTGARYTNVAPVWLARPQTHVLYSAYDHVFPHELVHVFSREFGLPVVRASVSVGLVEGLAVALEPPTGAPSAHELVSAALLSEGIETRGTLARSADLSESVASRLSPFGFWTGRGAVSYTAMGSFVAYLIDAYGVEAFKEAYPWAEFQSAYDKSLDVLADEWVAYVLSLEAVSRSSQDVVAARFAVPSLFEKDCPHYVPRYRRIYSEAESALIHGDTLGAIRGAEEALDVRPEFRPALELWTALSVRRGEARAVADRLAPFQPDTLTTTLNIRLADALALVGQADSARVLYEHALERLPAFAYEAKTIVRLRAAAAENGRFMRQYLSAQVPVSIPTAPAERALAALAAAEDGRYEQAFKLLRTMRLDGRAAFESLGGEVQLQRLAWIARFAYRAGMLSEALAFADSAAAAFRAAGAFNEASRLSDLRDRIRWQAERGMDRLADGLRSRAQELHSRVERQGWVC